MHYKEVKRILRYLKGIMDYSLYYLGKELSLVGYSNANWVGNLDECKLTSGYTFLLNNGVISWKSKN